MSANGRAALPPSRAIRPQTNTGAVRGRPWAGYLKPWRWAQDLLFKVWRDDIHAVDQGPLCYDDMSKASEITIPASRGGVFGRCLHFTAHAQRRGISFHDRGGNGLPPPPGVMTYAPPRLLGWFWAHTQTRLNSQNRLPELPQTLYSP